MHDGNTLAFLVFPYVALTVFAIGHLYRYVTDRYGWSARSSELLEKSQLRYGSWFFHWGIIFTFVGHAGGLLIPQTLYDAIGVDRQAHMRIAYLIGLLVGAAASTGILILLHRRFFRKRIRSTTGLNDFVTLGLLCLIIGLGTWNVLFGHHEVLNTVAPWIRSIMILRPDPELMRFVPIGYKLHILAALALLAFSPFSRLVHIWSVPVTYLARSYLVFRKREI